MNVNNKYLNNFISYVPSKRKQIKKRKGKSFDEHFEIPHTEKEKTAKCKICATEKNLNISIKMTAGNTTGIKRHLEKYHIKEYENFYEILHSSSESQVINYYFNTNQQTK